MHQHRSYGRFWLLLAFGTVAVLVLASIEWSLYHPYGVHWDEAQYLNDVATDVQRLLSGNVLKLGGRILIKSYGKPPLYRILALPFLAMFGFHVTLARMVSLACFVVAACFIFLTGRRIGNQIGAGVAVVIFALSPEVVAASSFYGTDAPLYLATAAMLYFLVKASTDEHANPANWIFLGLSLAFGLWSKTTFILVAGPALAAVAFLKTFTRWKAPSWECVLKAASLAAVLAAPWWILNLRAALDYTQYARGFVRNSLGSPSLLTWGRWFETVVQGLLGIGVSLFIAAIVSAFIIHLFTGKTGKFEPLQKTALLVCACTGLPIVAAQLVGTNHLLRHITPALIPLALVIGLLFGKLEWAHSLPSAAVLSLLCVGQTLMIVAPIFVPNRSAVDLGMVNGGLPWRVLVRFDQWDWDTVHQLSTKCGMAEPTIAYLGNGREFNPPQIARPWIDDRESPPDVLWLWRYEDGGINWAKVMEAADQHDIILTAPGYRGEPRFKEDADNVYNSEFAARLSRDPRFRGPFYLKMGRFTPVELLVYVKAAAACESTQLAHNR